MEQQKNTNFEPQLSKMLFPPQENSILISRKIPFLLQYTIDPRNIKYLLFVPLQMSANPWYVAKINESLPLFKNTYTIHSSVIYKAKNPQQTNNSHSNRIVDKSPYVHNEKELLQSVLIWMNLRKHSANKPNIKRVHIASLPLYEV